MVKKLSLTIYNSAAGADAVVHIQQYAQSMSMFLPDGLSSIPSTMFGTCFESRKN